MQPALETVSSRYFLTKTLPEIADWLQAQRVRTGESLTHAEDYSNLRQQFGRLSHRWHPLLTDQNLRQPQMAAVHQVAVQALELSKLIYAELEGERQGQSKLAPKPVLERLLDWNSQLLERVSSQLELVESTVHHAEDLHDVAAKLVIGQTVSPAALAGLARRIELEMRPQPEVWQWMPMPGLLLSESLAPRMWRSESEVYAVGLSTARLVAWLGVQISALPDQLELLIVAALLQDIGFLRLERTTQKTPSEIESRNQHTYRRHASLGAGLAAGVGQYSIELSFLIAQHHERLDGTGYPHCLTRYKQSKESQFLSCLARFQELVFRQPVETMSVEAACYQAGFQLFLESAQGAWSSKATVALLEALDIELPNAFDNSLATGQPFLADEFLERRWASHAAEPNVPAPHFLFSRSKSFSRFAGQTLSGNREKVVRHDPKG